MDSESYSPVSLKTSEEEMVLLMAKHLGSNSVFSWLVLVILALITETQLWRWLVADKATENWGVAGVLMGTEGSDGEDEEEEKENGFGSKESRAAIAANGCFSGWQVFLSTEWNQSQLIKRRRFILVSHACRFIRISFSFSSTKHILQEKSFKKSLIRFRTGIKKTVNGGWFEWGLVNPLLKKIFPIVGCFC